SASAANITARWETDLSPGTAKAPPSARPGVATQEGGASAMRVSTTAPSGARRSLPMAALEVLHVVDQRLHALHRHRVVDRGAHAAGDAVSLEADQPGLARLREEGLVQRRVVQEERDVHPRTRGRVDLVAVEAAGPVDRGVEDPGLLVAEAGERLDAALLQHPAEGEPRHVP